SFCVRGCFLRLQPFDKLRVTSVAQGDKKVFQPVISNEVRDLRIGEMKLALFLDPSVAIALSG
ncbi:hypothetical protein K0B03_04325, partial [Patescibacteria group bacterium]|nr:hypothetical protein [Patescibacteria group bacterium]